MKAHNGLGFEARDITEDQIVYSSFSNIGRPDEFVPHFPLLFEACIDCIFF